MINFKIHNDVENHNTMSGFIADFFLDSQIHKLFVTKEKKILEIISYSCKLNTSR